MQAIIQFFFLQMPFMQHTHTFIQYAKFQIIKIFCLNKSTALKVTLLFLVYIFQCIYEEILTQLKQAPVWNSPLKEFSQSWQFY